MWVSKQQGKPADEHMREREGMANDTARVRCFVFDTKFPPSSCNLGRLRVFGKNFCSHVGVK